MADKGVIARNTFYLSLAHGASKFFSVGLTAIATRVLGTVGYGYYTAGNTFIEVGRVVSSAGLDYLVTREVASDPTRASHVASNAVAVKMILAAVTYLALVGLVWWLDYPEPVLQVVLILGTILFLENWSDVADAVFMGRERMDFITRTLVVSSASIFVLGGGALLSGLGLRGFVLGIAVGCLVRSVVGTTFLRRNYGRISPGEVRALEVRRLGKAAIPLMGATVITLVFHRVDILMLTRLTEASQWGLYGAAVRVVDVVVLVPRILATAVYPALRRAKDESTAAAVALVDQSARITLVICSAIAIGVWIIAPYALRIIAGSEFGPATGALRILAWAIGLQGGAHMMVRLLMAVDAERDFLHIGGLGLVCNVGLNLWWIPKMGIEGAAWATLVSYGITLALYYIYAARRGYAVPVMSSVGRPLLALATAAGVSVWMLPRGQWVASAATVGAWLVALVVLRVTTVSELSAGLRLLRGGGR